MRVIEEANIANAVRDLCIRANTVLRKDVLAALKRALRSENNPRARDVLDKIILNARIARKEALAICQDTGLAVVFVEIGRQTHIKGDLKQAINKGVCAGYRQGFFRDSITPHPLARGKTTCAGALIHLDSVKGEKLKITVLPKGFGSENKAQLRMFKPTAEIGEIKNFVVNTVKAAGADACPPFIVGVGIGGTADYAMFLAKKALLKKITNYESRVRNDVHTLERDLLKEINKLNIGPMGLGGRTTALGVSVETYPTHIAGLPVAVNISCHALRSATKII